MLIRVCILVFLFSTSVRSTAANNGHERDDDDVGLDVVGGDRVPHALLPDNVHMGASAPHPPVLLFLRGRRSKGKGKQNSEIPMTEIRMKKRLESDDDDGFIISDIRMKKTKSVFLPSSSSSSAFHDDDDNFVISDIRMKKNKDDYSDYNDDNGGGSGNHNNRISTGVKRRKLGSRRVNENRIMKRFGDDDLIMSEIRMKKEEWSPRNNDLRISDAFMKRPREDMSSIPRTTRYYSKEDIQQILPDELLLLRDDDNVRAEAMAKTDGGLFDWTAGGNFPVRMSSVRMRRKGKQQHWRRSEEEDGI